MEVLQAKNLRKIYGSGNNAVHALDGVDLSVKKGEFVAIVGTSGSGKSTLLHMLGGLDRPTSGTVMVDGQDIFSLKEEALTIFRRRKIGFVFQAYNLVPVLNVYENIVLPIELDGGKVNKDFVQQIVQTLGLDDRLDALPNQLSGGQQQRVAIARALVNNPNTIIADEPTTALDVTIQAQILELMQDLRKKLGMSIIMITHDLGVVASMCEKIAVMYAGHIVEYGTTDEIFYQPGHEYTKGLINSIPKLNTAEHERLVPIEGTPVDLLNPPAGCPFAPRCKNCMKICLSKMPPRTELSDTHYTYCWLQQKAAFEKGEKAE